MKLTHERMPLEEKKRKIPQEIALHKFEWTLGKPKFQLLHASSWTNKRTPECFPWQQYLSLKLQEFPATALHSTSLLYNCRILSLINKSIWSNTIPLTIRYVCIFNSISHPLGNHLIFGIFAQCANWSYLYVMLIARETKNVVKLLPLKGFCWGVSSIVNRPAVRGIWYLLNLIT